MSDPIEDRDPGDESNAPARIAPGLYETTDISSPLDPLTLANIRGAFVLLADGSMVKPGETPIGRAAVREALAMLQAELERLKGAAPVSRTDTDAYNCGKRDGRQLAYSFSLEALDRLAERFR